MAGLANGDVLWFGLGSSQEPEVRAIDVTADRSDHAELTLVDADGNHTPVHLGIPGRHNVMNALAAATWRCVTVWHPKRWHGFWPRSTPSASSHGIVYGESRGDFLHADR